MEYKVIESKTVYKSEKVQVDKEKIGLPNGQIVEWEVMVYPNFLTGVPVEEGQVLMTKEWRQGPHDYLTQFTATRASHETESENLAELKRELGEELGVTDGDYEKIVHFAQGTRLTGFRTVYLVTNFCITSPDRDENEIQEIIRLPVKGLYLELTGKHVVTAETLLIAKLIEERFPRF